MTSTQQSCVANLRQRSEAPNKPQHLAYFQSIKVSSDHCMIPAIDRLANWPLFYEKNRCSPAPPLAPRPRWSPAVDSMLPAPVSLLPTITPRAPTPTCLLTLTASGSAPATGHSWPLASLPPLALLVRRNSPSGLRRDFSTCWICCLLTRMIAKQSTRPKSPLLKCAMAIIGC